MAGIIAFGAYVPRYRISREVIARQWGLPSMGGERAVANYDEDSLTMAAEAGLTCLAGQPTQDIGGLYFATTSSPYREKQGATTIATIADLSREIRTADFTDTLRAGTTAMIAALDAIGSGSAQKVLVTAGDCRMGEPDSPEEQLFGDGAGAVLLGKENGIAEVLGTYTLMDEFTGSWRTEDRHFIQGFPGGFDVKYGYSRVMGEVLPAVYKKFGISPKEIAKAVIYAPNPRALTGLAKQAGFDPKSQLQDTLFGQVGDTGAAAPLMMLAATLEEAKPGDKILLLSYGEGSDALLFQVTPAIEQYKVQRSIKAQIATKRDISSYGKYARFRNLAVKETTCGEVSTPVAYFRDWKQLLPLYGERCNQCGTLQYPKERVCYECGSKDDFADVKLAHTGKVFTYTHDYLFAGPDLPYTQSVIELNDGCRIYLAMTDSDEKEVSIDLPVELTCRRLHDGYGFHNYYWKVRPIKG